MDKLNQDQIKEALKDVRSSYRLLALYQKRVLDIIKYISNSYALTFDSGWSKFSGTASKNSRADITKSSWEWLALYLYEFNLGTKKIKGEKYHFKIVHQADTGYFDTADNKKVSKQNVDQYANVSQSETRLIFVLSKNDNGCPIINHLSDKLNVESKQASITGNWLSVPFNLESFSNQELTDGVIKEFNKVCKDNFGITLKDE